MEQILHRRINHNGECAGYETFMLEAMQQILAVMPQARFLQYAPLDGIAFPPEIQDRFCCQNDYSLIEFLDHKLESKRWAAAYAPILPYRIVSGHECTVPNLKQLFSDQEAVVVQRNVSCGGAGTFLVRFKSEYLPDLPVKEDELCMVTAFRANSISINVHAVLYQMQTLIFPPSIQIIDHEHIQLEYLGADFSAYCNVCPEDQELILKTAAAVCDGLRKSGYRGVCGIDFLLADGNCYFMEVNPRFQASTALLNHYLTQCGLPSVQEYHIDAFLHASSELPEPPMFAGGSFFIYHFHQAQENRLHWIWNTLQNAEYVSLCDDNLCWQNKLDFTNIIWITAPCMEIWHSLSPMQLDVLPAEPGLGLRYYGKMLFPVEIMPEDPCGTLQTKKAFIKRYCVFKP